MSFFRGIVRQGVKLSRRLGLLRPTALEMQRSTLRKLLRKAEDTRFGEHYRFSRVLESEDIIPPFQEQIPVHDYSSMFLWWERALQGEPSVTWPGQTKYFALSSGTSEGTSKYIPVTKSQIKAIRRAGARQLLAIARTPGLQDALVMPCLMVGGSTHLNFNGKNYSGDLSGITTGNIPFWAQNLSLPYEEIRAKRNWQDKLNEMVLAAKDWDIGMVAGVPAWIQILFERIIEHYKVQTIHDIWPNLKVYMWGGVALDPYRKSLEKLCREPLFYFETYLASEGFFAYQSRANARGMKLILKNGIFFEFIPFNEKNFTEDGQLKSNPEVLTLDQVRLNEEYALLITTCAGAWRYMIGDVVRFVSLRRAEIKITGRTKHFLSITGEHLSVDNMNQAIKRISDRFGQPFNEYTVAAIPYEGLFAHHWFISCENPLDAGEVKTVLDETLKELNDDYAVERKHALREIIVELVPHEKFLEYLRIKGKEGGQVKFPRVIRKEAYDAWVQFLRG